jgi:hypothetical protein
MARLRAMNVYGASSRLDQAAAGRQAQTPRPDHSRLRCSQKRQIGFVWRDVHTTDPACRSSNPQSAIPNPQSRPPRPRRLALFFSPPSFSAQKRRNWVCLARRPHGRRVSREAYLVSREPRPATEVVQGVAKSGKLALFGAPSKRRARVPSPRNPSRQSAIPNRGRLGRPDWLCLAQRTLSHDGGTESTENES